MMGTPEPARDRPRPPPCEESEAPFAPMHDTTETPAPPQDHALASSRELVEVTAALERSSVAAASSSPQHHGDAATSTEALSSEERSLRYALYWHHDGTRKNSAEAFAAMAARSPFRDVVMALLDKYNEDNGLLGDLAYELRDIVSYKQCFDGKGCPYRSYSHFNLTMKTKGADDSTSASNNLFFAEVTRMRGEEEEYVLSCICTVKPDDNGEWHVCGVDMKHPTDVEYKHGRPKLHRRCCPSIDGDDLFEELFSVRDEAWLKAQEARLRRMFKEREEDRRKLKVDNIGDGHGKRDKYVVPARR